jgi:hypothetical protein
MLPESLLNVEQHGQHGRMLLSSQPKLVMGVGVGVFVLGFFL